MTIPISCENCRQIINFLNAPKPIVQIDDHWFCDEDCKARWQARKVGQTVADIRVILKARDG